MLELIHDSHIGVSNWKYIEKFFKTYIKEDFHWFVTCDMKYLILKDEQSNALEEIKYLDSYESKLSEIFEE